MLLAPRNRSLRYLPLKGGGIGETAYADHEIKR